MALRGYSGRRGLINPLCVFEDSGWEVPEFARIKDEISGVVGDGGAGTAGSEPAGVGGARGEADGRGKIRL